jgi:RNA polymerase sigma-70 factor, ECF subfamily
VFRRNPGAGSRVRGDVAVLAETLGRVSVRSAGGLEVDDDASLVSATLAGRSEAFGTLVERYDRAVYNLCLRTLRDVEEAKDAAQEAFFKAFRGLRTYRPAAKFSTWIFSIAYHCCCDRLQRRKRISGSELPDRADPSPGPAALAERSDEAHALRAAIDELPEKYRAVITLYHLQGRQYEEIAQVLNLPMGTVKTHLFRAKEQLRRRLAGVLGETAEEAND